MYNESFGLRKSPFSLTPDPACLFLTEQHREALSGLTYAILQRRGFAVLTGEAGTGKTTLLARALNFIPASRLQFSMIMNPTMTPAEFLEFALLDFGVTDVPSSKAQRLWKLKDLLIQGERDGKVTALIVDEAHTLSMEVLEEIRMLGNFEQADHKCLQILLVGQSELDSILDREDMRQLKQRIGVRLTLGPIPPELVEQYIRHRWLKAGGAEHPFSPGAVEDLAIASKGIPRVINALCDNALLLAFATESSRVLARHIREVAADLNLDALPLREEEVFAEPVEPEPELEPELITPPDLGSTRSDEAPNLSRWTRWTDRFRLTPRHEST
jgi:general secretion pathway protein A